MAAPAARPSPVVPGSQNGGQDRMPPMDKNPLRFLFLWFVVPLVIVLLLNALGLPDWFGRWVASFW